VPLPGPRIQVVQERFHRNALVTHFQHRQVFCRAPDFFQ
jgi:hypothetical protein